MTKETIIEKLIDQGHITIPIADDILNKRPNYAQEIKSLHTDGTVNTKEAVILLSESTTILVNEPYIPPPNYIPPTGPSWPFWSIGPDIYCAPTETTGTPPTDLGHMAAINTVQPSPTSNSGSVGTDSTSRSTLTYNQDIP